MFNPKIFLYSILIFFVVACDFGFPKMKVDFSLLPDNEISNYIIKVYPNNPNNLKYIFEEKLAGNHNSENIKNVASGMGMTCTDTLCSYRAVVKQSIVINGEKKNSTFNFYIEIDPNRGLDSFVSKKF